MLVTFVLALCAILVLSVFLLMPGESSAVQRAPFWGRYFAHRGLHTKDQNVPENSLAAFTLAIDAGYGIELDLRLTKDGEVVVFHDDGLQRMCGLAADVRDKTLEELKRLPLAASNERIPTLREVLALVDCKAPLIIEFKMMGSRNTELCESAWHILRTYDGDICIESFDPRIVRRFKKKVPGVMRGQLSARPRTLNSGAQGALVGTLFTNFLARPHFIAYQEGTKPFTVSFAEKFAMRVVWTLRPEDEKLLYEYANDAIIFEYFEPEPQYKEMTAQALTGGEFTDVQPADAMKSADEYARDAAKEQQKTADDGEAAETGGEKGGGNGAK